VSIIASQQIGRDFEEAERRTCRRGDFSLLVELIDLGNQEAASNSNFAALEIEGPRNPFVLFLKSHGASLIGFYESWGQYDENKQNDENKRSLSVYEQFSLVDLSGKSVSSINLKLLPPALLVVMTNANLRPDVSQVLTESSFYDEFNVDYYPHLSRQQVNQKPAQSSQSELQILITSIFGQEAWTPLASRPLNEEKFLDSLERLRLFLSRPELADEVRLEEYPFKSLLLVTPERSGHTLENARAYRDIMTRLATDPRIAEEAAEEVAEEVLTDWRIAEKRGIAKEVLEVLEVLVVLATSTKEPIETQHLFSPLSHPFALLLNLQGGKFKRPEN